jgi:Ca2+-binding RTX toxin-like protein
MATITGTGSGDSLTGDTDDNPNDVIFGGGGADTLRGLSANDILYGGSGADLLYGGTGNDTLFGGSSGDTLYGGDGFDIASYADVGSSVTVNLATGFASGGGGSDILAEIEGVIGGSGGDTITGDSLGNLLQGEAGADLLSGGAGLDTLFGGTGSDTLYGGADADTLYGGSDADLLYGNDGLDALYGDAGADRLYGDAGDDLLDGGTEADSLFGGTGRDTLYGGAGVDSLRGGDNDDLLYGGSEGDNLFGDGGGDTLYGGAGSDTLDGGDGNDLLLGEDGSDTLYGGNGDDTLRGGDGGDALFGGTGLDFIDYSDSNAAVSINLATGSFSGGFATGDSGAGVDGIIGSAFDDTLVGFDGSSTDASDAYTNVFFGGLGNDSMSGLGGGDSLYGGADNDTISGDAGNDLLYGGTGRDILSGGADNDTLYGDAGQDVLYGGAGRDELFGGDDEDQFFVNFTSLANDISGAEIVDGGIGGTDQDTLTVDITGFGWSRIDLAYDPLNAENGTITFFGPDGITVIGTLSFSDIESLVIVCFTAGTQILTDQGPVAVETLCPGDLVRTRDHGFQPLRWVGQRRLSRVELLARPSLQPIRIAAGALFGAGPETTLVVSPQHRVLVDGPLAELYFAQNEVLVAAKHLLDLSGVTRECPEDGVTYVHLLFDRHEILLSNGAWTESFQPAERTIDALDAAARAEVLELFPELAGLPAAFPCARVSLRAHEARVLIAG